MKRAISIFVLMIFPVLIFAQEIMGIQSKNGTNSPELSWIALRLNVSPDFILKRAKADQQDFVTVPTTTYTEVDGDTTFFRVLDTTLTEKAIYKYFIEVTLAPDTVVYSDIMFGHNLGQIPKPVIANIKTEAVDDRKAISLSWDLLHAETVRSIMLFRSTNRDSLFEVAAILPSEARTYTDIVTRSHESYYYFIMIRDFFGYQVPTPVFTGISTYREVPYPPRELAAEIRDKGVTLQWSGLGDNIIGYHLFRRSGERGSFIQLTDILPNNENHCSWMDTTAQPTDKGFYEYYAISVSDGYLQSAPSDTVRVYRSLTTLPPPPEQVSSRINERGYVKLTWTLPPEEIRIAGYKVYRSTGEGKAIILTETLLPFQVNWFIDSTFTPGETSTYEIETLALDGRSSLTRTKLTVSPEPRQFHLVLTIERSEEGIRLIWTPPAQIPELRIMIMRQTDRSEPQIIGPADLVKGNFTDTGVEAGHLYTYMVIGISVDEKAHYLNEGISLRIDE